MNLTKITESLKSLVGWSRAGFEQHDKMLKVLENSRKVSQVCMSPEDYQATLNAMPTQEEVFNTWYRFSHAGGGVFPANQAETTAWNYEPSSGLLNNTTNSVTHIGMVSIKKYDKYVFDVRVWSNDQDDDTIGLVLAYNKDPVTGKENTIAVRRSPGGNTLYSVERNPGQAGGHGLRTIANNASSVLWGNGQPGSMTATEAGFVTNAAEVGWLGQLLKYGSNNYIRIRATRDGDKFTVQTSDWANPDVLIPASLIEFDLNSNADLTIFKGPQSYGYLSASQRNSFWRTMEFSNPNDAIYRLDTGEVLISKNGVWVVDPTRTVDDLGTNVWLANTLTDTMYYRDSLERVWRFGHQTP